MQKWMITGDWELTEERVDTARTLVEYMGDQFKKGGFNQFVFVGDMFREFTAKTTRFVNKLVDKNWMLIVGNHDREIEENRLTALFGDHGVFSIPYVKEISGVPVGILPAPNRAAFGASRGAEGRRTRDAALSEALEAALISLETQIGEENLSKAILFFHASIGGAELGKQKLPHGLTWEIPLARLERWGLAIGGHIHRPQQIAENVYYTGGIANWTFSDRAEEFRVLSLEIGDDGSFKVDSIPLPRMLIPIEIDLDHEGFKNGGEEIYPTDGNFASTLRGFLVDRCGVTLEDNVNLKIRARLSPDRLQALPKESELKGQLNEITLRPFIRDLKICREPIGLCKARIEVDREDMNLKQLFGVWKEATEIEISPEMNEFLDKNLLSLEAFYHPGEGNFGFKPLNLKIANFRQWDEVEIDFRDLEGAIAITGDNALGKSNLIEAILFALFKRSPSSSASIEDELRLGTSEGSVELVFITGGEQYMVRRALERNSRGVSCKSEFFEIEYEIHTEKSGIGRSLKPVCEAANDIDKKIIGLVGSYEFVISTFIGTQKEIDRLVDATPSEWNNLFLDALALDRFDPLRKMSDQKAEIYESEIKKLETRIDELEQQITIEEAELKDQPKPYELETAKGSYLSDIKIIEKKISDLREKKEGEQKKQAELQAKIREKTDIGASSSILRNKIKEFSIVDLGERPEMPENIEDLEQEKIRINELKKNREDIESELSTNRATVSAHEGHISSLGIDIKKTNKAIDDLDGKIEKAKEAIEELEDPPCMEWIETTGVKLHDGCPAWKEFSTGDHIERMQNEHDEIVEKLGKISQERAGRNDELARVKKDVEIQEKSFSDITAGIRELEQKIGEYENALKAIELWDAKAQAQEQLKIDHEERKREFADLQKKLESFGDLTEQIKAIDESISKLQKEIDEKKVEMDFYRDQISKIDAQLAKIEQLQEVLQKKREKLEGYRSEIEQKQLEAGAWRIFANAFHRTGIPYLLMERMIGAFERETNEILRPTDLSVSIETMTSTKKGEARDKIKVSFNDPRGQHPLTKASGYQRAVLGMALRAAMAAVGARFWGAVPEIYVQDEGWDRFNIQRHDIARELIASLSGRFTRLFYITHVDALADSADIRMKVVEENGRSVIAA